MRTAADRAADKRHYDSHREQRMASTQAWREKNRERYNAYMREYRTKRKKAEA